MEACVIDFFLFVSTVKFTCNGLGLKAPEGALYLQYRHIPSCDHCPLHDVSQVRRGRGRCGQAAYFWVEYLKNHLYKKIC
jgi:hypothetical protein